MRRVLDRLVHREEAARQRPPFPEGGQGALVQQHPHLPGRNGEQDDVDGHGWSRVGRRVVPGEKRGLLGDPVVRPRRAVGRPAAASPAGSSAVLAISRLPRRGCSGRGLAFWFRPLVTGVAEVPVDDREAPFLFHGRTVDFQDVTVQGALIYRIEEPERVAAHVDFTIDLDDGASTRTPLEQLAGLLTQLAQQATLDLLADMELRRAVREGIAAVRAAITRGLAEERGPAGIGLAVVAVRVTAVSPTVEVEQALQTPLLEAIQQQADEATFARRALAVDKERAIAENELANRIELARRERDLIATQGANERRRMEESAASARIEAEARAERDRLAGTVRAEGLREVGEAEAAAQSGRMAVYRDVPVAVLLGLAAGELAGKLERIDHLNLSPDACGGLLSSLLAAGTRRLEDGA